jgi:hypothetical protein
MKRENSKESSRFCFLGFFEFEPDFLGWKKSLDWILFPDLFFSEDYP